MNKILTVLMLVGMTANANAQETRDTFELRAMVISASRLPQPARAVTSAVTVIHNREFQHLGYRNAADVLRTVSGAALVQSGSYGAFTSMFLRGGESDYVQVLIDGVQVNSPGELFDYANLSLENIDRIEIVKGPVSVLYGSDAVAGVVQLFSKPGYERTRAHLTALAGQGSKVGAQADGNFRSVDVRGDVSGASGPVQYSVGLSHFGTEGALAYNNQHRLTSGTARIATTLGSRSHLAISSRLARNRFHYPTDGGGNLIDANQFHEADAVAFGVEAAHRLAARTELRALLSWNRNTDVIEDDPDAAADTLGSYALYSDENFRRSSADVRINRELRAGTTLTVGGELEHQSRKGSLLSLSSFGPFEDGSQARRGNRAAYAQLVSSVGKLSLQAGLRGDDNERFGDFVTYRVGGALQMTRHARVRASGGTGFKEPRFYEQFATGFVVGNRDLVPETSRSFEAGADLSVGGFGFGATAFTQTFRNLIQYASAAPGEPNYRNVGRVVANGVELEWRWVYEALTLRGSVTLLDTEVKDAGTGADPLYQEGESLIRRPENTASLAVSYGNTFNIGGVVSYVGKRDDLYYDDNFTAQRITLPSYVKVDLMARSPSFQGLRGLVKAENVFDEQYEEIFNFPARGRVVFVGVSMDR